MLVELGLEPLDLPTVAQHILAGKQLVQRGDARFPLGDLLLDVGRFAIRKFALATVLRTTDISCVTTRAPCLLSPVSCPLRGHARPRFARKPLLHEMLIRVVVAVD